MRLQILVGIAATGAIAGGCGGGARTVTVTTPTTTASSSASSGSTTTHPAPHKLTAEQVVGQFRSHGLTIGKATTMEPGDYGAAPVVAHGVHFFIPHLATGAGGRAFTGSSADLAALRHYYDSLGKASGLLFSWTFANARAGVLVQLNGQLPRRRAMQFAAIVKSL
jgi:hypothetical protein